jgi:YbbR domain-containing protein
MKNYISFFISIFAAFILWLVVNLNGEYEENFKAKIVIKNLDPKKAIKTEYPDFVDLKLKGQGWKLLPFYFFSSPQIFIDLSNVHQGLKLNLSTNHRVHVSLPENVRVVAFNPETLSIELDKKIERRVPIELKFRIKGDNYGFTYPPKLNPDSVTISGAETIISKIESISTEEVSIEKIGKYNLNLPLVNPFGKFVKLSENYVQTSFEIEQIVEREFIVPIQAVDVPSDKEVLFFPPNIKVIVSGALSKLVEVNSVDFTSDKDALIKAFVSYRDVVNDKTGLVKPQIIIPENLKLVSVRPEGLEYIIRQK